MLCRCSANSSKVESRLANKEDRIIYYLTYNAISPRLAINIDDNIVEFSEEPAIVEAVRDVLDLRTAI